MHAEQAPALQKALRQKVAGAGSWKSGWHELYWWGQQDMCGTPIAPAASGEGLPGSGKQVCTQRPPKHAKECREGVSGVRSAIRHTRI